MYDNADKSNFIFVAISRINIDEDMKGTNDECLSIEISSPPEESKNNIPETKKGFIIYRLKLEKVNRKGVDENEEGKKENCYELKGDSLLF